MDINEDCRKVLIKMQRFDRYLYPVLSEKQFKDPIEKEVKRLEKVKNQNKSMWKNTYDNELLLIALMNHIRLVVEMNRELQDREGFKNEVRELQKKIHQMRLDHTKELKEGKGKVVEESVNLKSQEVVSIKKIITLLENEDSDQAQIELKKFVTDFEKVHMDLGRLCELFRNYVFDFRANQKLIKESSLKKLIVNIDQIT